MVETEIIEGVGAVVEGEGADIMTCMTMQPHIELEENGVAAEVVAVIKTVDMLMVSLHHPEEVVGEITPEEGGQMQSAKGILGQMGTEEEAGGVVIEEVEHPAVTHLSIAMKLERPD